jgi:hypothetical protein
MGSPAAGRAEAVGMDALLLGSDGHGAPHPHIDSRRRRGGGEKREDKVRGE